MYTTWWLSRSRVLAAVRALAKVGTSNDLREKNWYTEPRAKCIRSTCSIAYDPKPKIHTGREEN